MQGVQLGLAARAADGVQGRAQEIRVADTRQFHRILEGEEETGSRTFLRLHGEDILAEERGGAARNFVTLAS